MATGTDRTGPAAMHPKGTRTIGASVFSALFVIVRVVHAGTLTYGIDAGVGEADNVTLSHDDKISQTIAVTDVDFDYKEKSRLFNADAKGDFSYLDYLQNAYHNQLLGRFDGNAEFALIPQRLTWALQEDFGQAAIDPFTPATPTNLESINYVATGPDLYIRLGGASFVDLSARVARAQFESSPFSNNRAMGSVAWGLPLSPLSSITLNGDTERVLFENTALNIDFERSNAFVRYELQGARTEFSLDLGATVVREGASSATGGLARFKFARKLSPSAHFTMDLGRVYTDGTTSFSTLQGGSTGVVGAAPATNSSENYTSSYGSMGWEYMRNRTTLGVSGRLERDVYPGQSALNRTLTSFELRLQRQLTRAFSSQITARVYKLDYVNVPVIENNASPVTETNGVIAGLVWRHGRALEVKLAYALTEYRTSPNDTGYRDNRLFLTVGYRPFKASPGESVPGN